MALPMSRPWKHPKTGMYWFRHRVPLDLVGQLKGKPLLLTVGARAVAAKHGDEIKFTLGTKDPATAKERHAEALVQVQQHWTAIRSGSTRLSHREIIALAGTMYRDFTHALSENPGDPGRWAAVRDMNSAAMRGEYGLAASLVIPVNGQDTRRRSAMRERFGPFVDAVLQRERLVVDEAT